MTATITYTSSREASNRLAVARVAAAGRVTDARRAADAQRDAWYQQGQSFAEHEGDVDFCHICGRCTDHLGEHSPEQVQAWRERRWAA